MKDTNQYSYCNVVGDTDVGCKRKANEDWYAHFECKNGLVPVVCDGMGGHVGGAVASHLAVETIQLFLESNYFDDPRKAIIEACNAANSAILQRTSQQPELTGMGSTCVMLIVRNGKVYMGSVGDSRIYLVRSKTITQLTKDQSYVQMLVDEGAITKEQAEHHPRKNEITNALGLPSMQPATVLPDPINPEAGDCFLLCSDGLSGMVSDHEIMKVASNQTGMTQRERVSELIQRARKNGGLDNITCLIVEFAITPAPGTNGSGTKNRILFRYVLPCVAAVLLLGVVGYALWKHFHKKVGGESEYVSEMRHSANTRVIPMQDTILVLTGKPFAKVEELKGLGTYVYITDHKGNIDTLTLNFIGFVRVVPDSIFTPSLVSGSRTFVFNDKMTFSNDISLTFKKGDSTLVYVFPVKNPSKFKELSSLPTDKKVTSDNETKKSGEIIEKDYTDNEIEKVLNADIVVNKKGEKHIILNADQGIATNDELFTGSCAIKAENVTKDWYSYKSDGRTCHITIFNNKVPSKNAHIDIPLINSCAGEFFTINVKVAN